MSPFGERDQKMKKVPEWPGTCSISTLPSRDFRAAALVARQWVVGQATIACHEREGLASVTSGF